MKHRNAMKLVLAVAALQLPMSLRAQIAAFPEAEGFGAGAVGGRGGSVYHVTNLNDSGAGSFRDAVSQANRIVVFDVGGYITLSSQLTVKDHVTIAGQTAPGEGIATRGASVSFKNANNTIVRNMRFRLGPGTGGDAVWADTTTTDVMFDHITAQWGLDESFSVTGCDRITMQNCIVAEGLLTHSMGSLIEWNTISQHHNLYISNNSRNPKTKGVNDFVNNVVYNWGTEPYIAGDSAGVSEANVVNNYFIRGPSSGADPDPFSRGNENYHLYLSGNYYDSNKNGIVDGTLITQANIDDPMTYMPSPYAYPAVRTDSALKAYQKVVANVGASLVRDAVDQRLINDLVNQTGKILTDPVAETTIGFGTITGGVAPTDTDQDGMPDAWETARGLNPANAADRNNIGATGYTRVEEYLNDLMTARNAQHVWTSAGGTWSSSGNWTGGLPSTDDDAFVRGANAASNGVVNVSAGTAGAFRLYIGQTGAPAGEQVNVSGSGVLEVPFLINVGYQNTAALNVSGGQVNTWAIALGNTLNGTFAGSLNFSGGTIRAGRIDAGGTGTFTWSGGTLKAMRSELTITPAIAMSGSAGTFDTETDGVITASGVLSGAVGVTKLGTGDLALTNPANTYTGATIIEGGGTLTIGSIANGGSPSSLGTASSSATNLVLNGGVKIQFAGGGTSNRGLTIDQGGLTLATNSGIIFTLSGPMVFSGSGDRTLSIDLTGTSSNISTLSGAIGDPASGGKTSLVKDGAARLSLSGTAKTYSGDTTLNAGSVLAFNTNVLPYGTGKGNVIINSGASLDVRNNININGLSGAGSLINGSGGARTVTLGNGNASGVFSGPIINGTSIVKVGTGSQVFSGVNTYTGTTTISGGILQFNQSASIGSTGASVTVAAGAISAAGYAIDQPYLARHNIASAGTIALAVDSTNNLDFSATAANLANVSLGSVGNTTFSGLITPFGTTYRLGGGTGTLTLSGANALGGANNVTIVGGGATAPTGVNNYTGVTSIQSNGLLIANTIADGAVACSIGAAAGDAANLVFDGGTLRSSALTAQYTNRLFTLTQNGGIIESSGSAPLVFSNGGAIALGGSGNRALTLSGSHYNVNGNDAFSPQIADPASGVTSLIKDGTGRWFLQGSPKTYSGDTTVLNGDLYTNVTNVLPYGAGKGNLVINGGRLFMYGGNLSINALNGTGGTLGANGSKTVTMGNADASGSYAGVVTNAITIVKTGAGTQALAGDCTYTGNTTINGGALRFTGSYLPATPGALSVTGTAQANIDGGNTLFKSFKATNLRIQNSGRLAVVNSGATPSVNEVTSLTVSTGGQLDLGANGMIVRTPSNRDTIWALVESGRNGLDSGLVSWNGPGIVSSVARSNNVSSLLELYTVGVIANHDLDSAYRYGPTNPWMGNATIGADDVLVRFTYSGDTNLDGAITIVDYVAIDSTYGGTHANTGWASGDFNGDGVIGIEDYVAIDTGYAFQQGTLSQSFLNLRAAQFGPAYVAQLETILTSLASVPEPLGIGAFAAFAIGALASRRRR